MHHKNLQFRPAASRFRFLGSFIPPVWRYCCHYHSHASLSDTLSLTPQLPSPLCTSTVVADVLAPLSCYQVGSISIYACAILPFVFNIKRFCVGCIIILCILAFPISETIKWFQEVSKSTSQTAYKWCANSGAISYSE